MSAPQPDLSKWLNDQQACGALGCSERTLYRHVTEKRLHPLKRPRPGSTHPERVFDPEEIRRMLPAPPMSLARREEEIPSSAPQMAELAGLPPLTWPAVIEAIEHFGAMSQPRPQALWVRTPEAAEITGLSETLLRRLVKQRRLRGLKDGATKICRADLETLDPTAGPAKRRKRQ